MGSDLLDAAIGIVHLAVAAVLIRHVRGSTRMFPWLTVLAVFFAVRGVDRIAEGLTDAQPPFVEPVADALVLAMLVLLLVGLERTVAKLRDAYRAADERQAQYSQALSDYERLTRHRLANPLAALRGGVVTLREVDSLSPEARDRLLEMLEEQTIRLQHLSLDPRRLSPEELRLRPSPGDVEFPHAA